jgi:peptidyl-tRNA hydrolase, PTH2 family
MTDTTDEVVMYLVFRADLNLPKGKLAAQAGHAVQLTIRDVELIGNDLAWDGRSGLDYLGDWEDGSYTKIALKVADEAELEALCDALDKDDFVYAQVVDEGRTVVKAGTITALGIQPLPKSLIKPYVEKLRLL